jgi:hypothetical protein
VLRKQVVPKLDDGEARKLPALTEQVLRPYVGGEETVRIAGG